MADSWRNVMTQLRGLIGETLIWWGFQVLPDDVGKADFVAFYVPWLVREARRDAEAANRRRQDIRQTRVSRRGREPREW
jgi:hypothetical protein